MYKCKKQTRRSICRSFIYVLQCHLTQLVDVFLIVILYYLVPYWQFRSPNFLCKLAFSFSCRNNIKKKKKLCINSCILTGHGKLPWLTHVMTLLIVFYSLSFSDMIYMGQCSTCVISKEIKIKPSLHRL